MYRLNSDYTEGCTPEILEGLQASNMEQSNGYGVDSYCEAAAALIKKECQCPNAAVHLMMGGTQTNLTVISAMLRSYQGVYATTLSHINTHEAGAIERSGHKVLALPSADGKITAAMIAKEHEAYLHDPSREHWVMPKMVYISQPTEIGSLYHKDELAALYAECQKYGLYLYIDGARLGYGLAATDNDLTLPELAKLCDAFYIGGTKCGALFGEATVITNPIFKEDFMTIMKQCGSVLAKGRMLGIQFEVLFSDGLYYRICKRGTQLAMQVKAALLAQKIPLVTDSTTNQLFVVFPPALYEQISKHFILSYGYKTEKGDIVARICTGWATKAEQIDKLCRIITDYK